MHGNFKPRNFEGLLSLPSRRLRPLPALAANDRSRISSLFGIASSVLGPIGARKYLHFLYPMTFVMWDFKIQKYVFGGVVDPTETRRRNSVPRPDAKTYAH